MKVIWRTPFLLRLLSLLLLAALLSACDRQPRQEASSAPLNTEASASQPTAPETEALQSSETSTKRAEIPDFPPHLQTELNYLQNLEIPEGDPAEIVLEQGIMGKDGYGGALDLLGWTLGADAERNLLTLTTDGELYQSSRAGENQLLYPDLRSDPAHEIQCTAWDGGSYVVWAEHPPFEDIPYGVGWEVQLLNLQTGEKRVIDRDQGLRPVENSSGYYLTPLHISIADGYVVYISHAPREDGTVVEAIMLYEIASDKLEAIGWLQGDPTENRMGASSVGGGYVSWCQAYERPEDALYEGYSLLYDLSTRETHILQSPENLINTCMVGDWVVCENHPNRTYYDSEIVAYQISKNQWRYKISPEYPGYRDFGDNLGHQSAWKHYVTWSGDSLPHVLLLDLEHGVQYMIGTIARDTYDELYEIHLYPGGLLTWCDTFKDAEKELQWRVHYVFLREEPQTQDDQP